MPDSHCQLIHLYIKYPESEGKMPERLVEVIKCQILRLKRLQKNIQSPEAKALAQIAIDEAILDFVDLVSLI